ncbi:MAG: hypothetical protein JXO72_05025 [Vicinamibacteria bacterium]|nr:hypothetical protein [Vicinamibacteria bacterium]
MATRRSIFIPGVLTPRAYIAENDNASTVVGAPVHSGALGIGTEASLGPKDGLPHASAIRCDFLALMFKRRLATFVGSLSEARLRALDRALAMALDLPVA